MADQTKTKIILRNGTAAQWTAANPVLLAGEAGVESDTQRQKFGDGATHWNDLEYAAGSKPVTATVWGEVTGTLSNQTDLKTVLDSKESTARKGASNGYAPLDESGKVPAVHVPVDTAKIDAHIAQTGEAHGIPSQIAAAVTTHKADVNAHGLTADIKAALTGSVSPSAVNPFVTRQAVPDGFVKGMILMWAGKTEEVPTGWALCDGQNGRPNLLGKFIRGIGTAGSQPGGTGGGDFVTLAVNNMPAHNHSLTMNAHTHTMSAHSHTIGNHNHSLTSGSTENSGAHLHFFSEDGKRNAVFPSTDGVKWTWATVASGSSFNVPVAQATPAYYTHNNATANSGSNHYHYLTGNTGTASPSSSAETVGCNSATSSGSIGNTGSGAAFDNRPTYYELAYIIKL